ncbi:MAG: cobalamin-independent methionine synthase II family protein [Deltaproteobacteria bacterium]|nr:cobalamin-independent methionine synthase II family protein [Deltaproteobacteria bacterium]
MTTALLPTTMVGSYPRPAWFEDQLEGKDVLEVFKVVHRAEAFEDAVRVVIADQEDAGLDILTDGQMWFDDYQMGIGSFLWYWLERTGGFSPEKLPHPARSRAKGRDVWALDEAGGVALVGPVTRGPIRLAALYDLAQRHTSRPIKACVGAGPVQLSTLAHFVGGPIKDRYELSFALAEVFAAEVADLVRAGCRYVQLEDLGAWIPTLSGDRDFEWVRKVVDRVLAGVDAERSWHFCLGNAWGNRLQGMTAAGYEGVLPRYYEADVDQFVLDFACRGMRDAALLADLPRDKKVAVGVIDVRSLEIEPPEQVAERVRQVLRYISPERVTLTTDCGMKQLPRPCAVGKLRSLVAGAAIVRRELTGV